MHTQNVVDDVCINYNLRLQPINKKGRENEQA